MLTEVGISFTHWSLHTSVVLGLIFLGGCYLLLIGPMRERVSSIGEVSPKRAGSFFLGLFVVFVALNGPLHDLSDHYLFSAHMVQHLLLQLLMPPLLLLGLPQVRDVPILSGPRLITIFKSLTNPIICFITFNGVLVSWHLPPLYDFALQNHNVHIIQHLTFMFVGVLAWWPVLSPSSQLPRALFPIQIIYIFAQSIPMGFLGAAITFSGSLLYTHYVNAPRVWSISPLADQQMGGLIMKSSAGLVFLLGLGLVFLAWFRHEENA